MTKHLLDVSDRSAVFQHVGGACMAEGMCGDMLIEPCKTGISFYNTVNTFTYKPITPSVQDKITGIITIEQGRAHSKDIASCELTYPLT